MSVKLALLKSGEDIISDIQEMVIETDDGSNKVVGYFFNKPCVVRLKQPEIVVETDNTSAQRNQFEIKLIPWITLAKDSKIPVPTDWVVTIVEPIDKVKKIYEEKILSGDENGTENN